MSAGLDLMSAALVRVEETLQKADAAILQVQDNLKQVTTQRIGLAAQKSMLTELKSKLEEYERKNSYPESGTVKGIPSIGPDCGSSTDQTKKES